MADKKMMIDGKPVIFKSKQNTQTAKTIRDAYKLIPDNKAIPIVFQTKTQYLNEYIRNQEKKKKIDFTPGQEKAYKKRELKDMRNIVSRYTTNHNPFIDRRVVFFTDKKMPKTQFKKSVLHEYGHELWETKPGIRRDWRAVNRNSSPTRYGATDRQEDFAESYMLYKTGQLQDPKRKSIFKDNTSKNKKFFGVMTNEFDKSTELIETNADWKPRSETAGMSGRALWSESKTGQFKDFEYIKGLGYKETPLDLSEFDVNHDGKINDADMNILRKRDKIKRDETSKGNVADALGIDIPEEYLYGNEWKFYGAAKQYDPRLYDNSPLSSNIKGLLMHHNEWLRNSGIPNKLSTGLSSDSFSFNQEDQKELPPPQETPANELLYSPSPDYPEVIKDTKFKKKYKKTGMTTGLVISNKLGRKGEALPVYEAPVQKGLTLLAGPGLPVIVDASDKPSKKTVGVERGRKGLITKAATRLKFATQGIKVVPAETDYSKPIYTSIGPRLRTEDSTTPRLSEAKSTLLSGVGSIGGFFQKAEQKELARLDEIDKEKQDKEILNKLLALKGQGILSGPTKSALESIQTAQKLGPLIDLPAPEEGQLLDAVQGQGDTSLTSTVGQGNLVFAPKLVPWSLQGNPTYKSNVPGLWHI